MASRLPFTESQWEELEHQAMIFKYISAGIPVPPDLLFPLRRTNFFSSSLSSSCSSHLSSKLFSRTAPPHFAWNVYDMGLGRKIDPEPGRCRRTDGKKWRCSKEAYPDSKYCERHMHRGKNRSRKPVEFSNTISSSSSSSPSSAVSANRSALSISNNLRDTSGNLSSFSLNSASGSRPIHGLALAAHDHDSARLFLESSGSSYSIAVDNDPRGRRTSGYIDDFFSGEPSGTIRSFSGSSTIEDCSWGYTNPTVNNMKTKSSYSPKQRNNNSYTAKPDRHCFVLGTDLTTTHESPLMFGKKLRGAEGDGEGEGEDGDGAEEEEEEQRNKRVHRFLDEWPSSNSSSVSTSLFI